MKRLYVGVCASMLVVACQPSEGSGDSVATSSTESGDGDGDGAGDGDGEGDGDGDPAGDGDGDASGDGDGDPSGDGDGDASGDGDGDPGCAPEAPGPDDWSSALVYPGEDNYLVYESDDEGNRIPDFSYAGYHRGDVELPELPVELELAPSGGDDTDMIQAALDEVGELPLDEDGHRGAVLLGPGEYTIAGTLLVRASGVVLRGSGDGEDPMSDTILRAVGNTPNQRDVVVLGSGSHNRWSPELPDTRTNVTSELVPVGAFELEVEAPENFSVGDHVVIYHPCTDAWLAAVDYGGTASDGPWEVGDQPLVFKREILAVEGSTLRFDAPLFNTLDRALSQAYVYVADRSELVTEVGIEDLRVDIETAGGEDEDHAWNAVVFVGVEDAWARRLTVLHYGLAGVDVRTGVQITVSEVDSFDPVAQLTGGRMYNFNVSGGQQILYQDCAARGGRHHFVSNGTSWTSGVVFHRSSSEQANTSSEGHRRWSMGLLFDSITDAPVSPGGRVLGLFNRGDYGTGHGWSAAHSVAWNYDAPEGTVIIQKPPTAQNYAIGGAAQVASGDAPPAPFDQPAGWIEGVNQAGLFPPSLYEAQLFERQCPAP